ncbi:hypothetical protein [Staphylococcus aureus]|uniref:hypothetical protein n=1 Tax=Staphylococcus aureus TaxID=1280 RepID=UPI00164323A1|nr:hypothetical protein [Staphylococcus aureus]
MNIRENEIVRWILGYRRRIEDMKEEGWEIDVVGVYLNEMGEVAGLDYDVSDGSGD